VAKGADCKATSFCCLFNDPSDKTVTFDPFPVNGLAAVSERLALFASPSAFARLRLVASWRAGRADPDDASIRPRVRKMSRVTSDIRPAQHSVALRLAGTLYVLTLVSAPQRRLSRR
jgi:hypothetical protein